MRLAGMRTMCKGAVARAVVHEMVGNTRTQRRSPRQQRAETVVNRENAEPRHRKTCAILQRRH